MVVVVVVVMVVVVVVVMVVVIVVVDAKHLLKIDVQLCPVVSSGQTQW